MWWRWPALNRQPAPYERAALPIVLQRHRDMAGAAGRHCRQHKAGLRARCARRPGFSPRTPSPGQARLGRLPIRLRVILSITAPGATTRHTVVGRPSRGTFPARRSARRFPATTFRRCTGVRRLPAHTIRIGAGGRQVRIAPPLVSRLTAAVSPSGGDAARRPLREGRNQPCQW